jgi:HPt (histidine-containing phosphotransfer) domain-containing protein
MTDSVIDRALMENLIELMDGDTDMVIEVIDLFLEDAPHQIEAIFAGVENRDPASVARAAHSLKGSSANVGARGLWGVCANLEVRGRNGSVAGVEGVCASLRREFDAVRAALADERRRIGNLNGGTAEDRLAV